MATDVVTCTGLAASWCPIHGDCTCRKRLKMHGAPEDMWRRSTCPIHGDESDHPDATWTPDVLDVLRAATPAPSEDPREDGEG